MSDDVVGLAYDPAALFVRGGGDRAFDIRDLPLGLQAVADFHRKRECRKERDREKELYVRQLLVRRSGREERVGSTGDRRPVRGERDAHACHAHRSPPTANRGPHEDRQDRVDNGVVPQHRGHDRDRCREE